jgi:hypothetical protein
MAYGLFKKDSKYVLAGIRFDRPQKMDDLPLLIHVPNS